MTTNLRYILGALVMVLPLFMAVYYRDLAAAAFKQAKTYAPAAKITAPDGISRLMGLLFSVKRGGGPEFFLTPDWVAAVTHTAGRQHIADFKRCRFMFWLFMLSLPFWFTLVSRLFWQ
jgi:hypothetical protein